MTQSVCIGPLAVTLLSHSSLWISHLPGRNGLLIKAFVSDTYVSDNEWNVSWNKWKDRKNLFKYQRILWHFWTFWRAEQGELSLEAPPPFFFDWKSKVLVLYMWPYTCNYCSLLSYVYGRSATSSHSASASSNNTHVLLSSGTLPSCYFTVCSLESPWRCIFLPLHSNW